MIDLPDGFTVRAASRDDTQVVLDLVAAAEEHLDGAVEVALSDVEVDFSRVGFEPATDCVIVLDGELPVAWAMYHKERAEADTRPSHYGRGIGSALLRWTEGRARAAGAGQVTQTITDNNTAAAELFRANGYTPRHTSWVLELEFNGPPESVPAPPGISIRPYDADTDEKATYRLIEDAFGEWEGRMPMSLEEWRAIVARHDALSPQVSRLAFDGDELVGAALAFDYPDEPDGWVEQVATKASHRHRGIATALLSEVFRAHHQRGKAFGGLGTDSRTGALGLYQKLGMRVRRSYTNYGKALG